MGSVALVDAAAFLGRELDLAEGVSIAIEGGRIVEVSSEPSSASERFDARGMTLVPGFIDAHVHIGFYEPREVLEGGVTTVRDLGWPPDRIHPLAERSRSTSFGGPEIHAVGPILTAPGGYPTRAAWAPAGTAREIRNEADARDAVDELAERGAAAVKVALNPPVGPTFELATLRAVVAAAHGRGLKVTGHVHGVAELHKALDAGMDELAHMLMGAEEIPDDTIGRMVDQGMTVVPTLSCRFGSERALAIRNLARFIDAGGRVVYGTDLGNEGPRPGIDESEVRAMGEAGMSAADIVRSATAGAADWLGLDDRGSLEAGRRADIVALAGIPRTPRDLTRVVAVWRAGELRALRELDL